VLPTLQKDGHLPPGVHATAWPELLKRFGNTPYRLGLLRGLRDAALNLKGAGCSTLYVDGSFVTSKRVPKDYDGCWDPAGVDLRKLDPVLMDFTSGRAAQKAKYGGELFPSSAPADGAGSTFLEFFQSDRDGIPKGLVMLDLRSLET
jgi:hypothetical protein